MPWDKCPKCKGAGFYNTNPIDDPRIVGKDVLCPICTEIGRLRAERDDYKACAEMWESNAGQWATDWHDLKADLGAARAEVKDHAQRIAVAETKERPIPFNAPMVRAILDGRKTKTRRPIKPQPDEDGLAFDLSVRQWMDTDERIYVCPYGRPGDRLWVREALRLSLSANDEGFNIAIYDADGVDVVYPAKTGWRWHKTYLPATAMPRWASRITLEIVSVGVERVQEISENDARAEGANKEFEIDVATFVHGQFDPEKASTHKLGFKHLWNQLYPKRPEYRWASNPWVWVIGFKVVASKD